MVELHGWVTIRETYKAIFEAEDNIHMIVKEIARAIEDLQWFKPQINALNGSFFIEFSIFSNRQNSQTEEVFKLFKRIGEIAEGSYGLIYLHDDEIDGKENQFQVFSLARGIVKEFSDSYLSPIIPTIEDEDLPL